ncbi:hypothetical protein [Vibrio coralliirubri]|nr:hypothetical protein [Vibrio coralliirubri]CDT87709.1 hypothetical protein VCR29J2_700332 [Vibrio coralliirubri]
MSCLFDDDQTLDKIDIDIDIEIEIGTLGSFGLLRALSVVALE